MNLRKHLTIPGLIGLGGSAALGVLIGYGLFHPTNPIGIIGIALGILWAATLVVSYFGMRLKPRRIHLSLCFYQSIDHAWVDLSSEDANSQWSTFDAHLGNLQMASQCQNCAVKRFLVATDDGRKLSLYADGVDQPLTQWSVGLMVRFSRDANRPLEAAADSNH